MATKTEISREVINGVVRVTYDDGTTENLELQQAPESVNVDADYNESQVSGHKFEDEQ